MIVVDVIILLSLAWNSDSHNINDNIIKYSIIKYNDAGWRGVSCFIRGVKIQTYFCSIIPISKI